MLFSLLLATVGSNSPSIETVSHNLVGESLYQSHCYRCHGSDGDATDYYDIVPLAGIRRRPPIGLVGLFRQESFSARGVEFSGERARALQNHLFQLRGRKGFNDPGWLWSSYLLNRKAAFTRVCRILDLRSAENYSANHIPNAVSFPRERSRAVQWDSLDSVTTLFQELGIDREMQVVIYDQKGGPEAAWVWRNLRRTGHSYVSILDGGWDVWVASNYPVSSRVTVPRQGTYKPRLKKDDIRIDTRAQPTQSISWDWNEAIGPEGFKEADALITLMDRCGLAGSGLSRIRGTAEEVAFLVFVLRLLNRSCEVSRIDDSHFVLHLNAE